MAVQVYTFKITYAGCDNKIWRTAAVSSNYTLSKVGYMVLATFDTKAYHLFEMKYKDTTYFLTEEGIYKRNLLRAYKVGQLGLSVGDTIEMTYDMGCEQVFHIELLEVSDMPRGHGTAYPKILDRAGRGIVDDMPASELLEVIRKTDEDGRSEIYYSSSGSGDELEWDYRDYRIVFDNALLKGAIEQTCDGYKDNP